MKKYLNFYLIMWHSYPWLDGKLIFCKIYLSQILKILKNPLKAKYEYASVDEYLHRALKRNLRIIPKKLIEIVLKNCLNLE